MSVNKVIIVGRLGRDPEQRFLSSGSSVTTIAVATSEKWKDQNGEAKEQTEWHRIEFFGRLADVAAEYLKKGSQVYVEGKLRTEKYTDKNGVEKQATKILGNVMQMIGGRENASQQAPSGQSEYGATKGKRDYQPATQPRHTATSATYDDDLDIPF